MDRLTALPDEILVDIVERVHAQPPDVLSTLGLTCKRLQRLCRPILERGVVVPWRLNKNAPIAKFVVNHKGTEDIRSIRLCPQRAVLNAFRIKMKNAYDHVDALCQCLYSLPSLETFSIFLAGQIDRRCALPGPVLAQIVRALPPSLRNLELDTESIDEIWDTVTAYHRHPTTVCTNAHHNHPGTKTYQNPADDPTTHLCHAISEHIPHLETLNLRLSCICTELFLSLSSQLSSEGKQPTSTLRRALITFDVGDETERHSELHVELRDCLSKPTGATRYSSQGATTLAKQKVFKHLLDLQAAGAFPDLERFIVFSWHTDAQSSRYSINVRDVATRTVTSFPKFAGQDFGIMWSAMDRGLDDLQDETTYLVISEDGTEFMGSKRRLERAVLHDVRWREVGGGEGVRMPPSKGMLKDETVTLCGEELVDLDTVRQAVNFNKVYGNAGAFGSTGVVVEQL